MSVLALSYHVCPGDRVQLAVDSRSRTGRKQHRGTYPVCRYSDLVALSSELLAVLRRGRAAMGECVTDADLLGAKGCVQDLRERGRRLASRLLPETLVKEMSQDTALTHVIFECDPLLNMVPFDCILLSNDFLAFRYATGKQLRSPRKAQPVARPAAALPYRGYGIVNPDGTLANATAAYVAFKTAWIEQGRHSAIDFGPSCTAGNAVPSGLVAAWSDADFVNTICHHVHDASDPAESGYVLGPSSNQHHPVVLTAKRLLDIGSAGRAPLMVFSVSCESAITRGWEAEWPDGQRLYGVIDAALRSGVRHYVGTIIEIPANRSPQILQPFYAALAEGHSVGEAMQCARRALRKNPDDPFDGGTILGLSFVLYGDPLDAYFCAAGHRTDESMIVLCEQLDDGRPCARAVCAQDPGFSKAMCKRHFTGGQILCSAGHPVTSQTDLKVCRGASGECHSTVCRQCAGWAQQLCSEHICHKGHEILDASVKECPDPDGKHAGERRLICPLDDGWMLGLCDSCRADLSRRANATESCPHCGTLITPENPWFGVCCGCGQRTCSQPDCGPWHLKTLYCRKPPHVRSTDDKDACWIDCINKLGEQDRSVASLLRLREISVESSQFCENVATNIAQYLTQCRSMPSLSPSTWPIVGRVQRLFKPHRLEVDLSDRLVESLIQGCGLPVDPNTKQVWRPPAAWLGGTGSENGLQQPDGLQAANRLIVHTIRAPGSQPVIAAVCTLAPVDFQPVHGPLLVPCGAQHVEHVQNVLADWWRAQHDTELPDLYLLVLAAAGLSRATRPNHAPGRVTLLAEAQGDTWVVRKPPMEGMPAEVREFASILTPETVFAERQRIREWLVHYLQTWDHVEVPKVQSEMEQGTARPVSTGDVLTVFDDLAASGRYVRTEIGGKQVLCHANHRS